MADHHEAKDVCKVCKGKSKRSCKACGGTGLSKRNTYRHALGVPLQDNNAGALKWDSWEYAKLHAEAWRECFRVIQPGPFNRMWLNISDHIRGGVRQPVVGLHLEILQEIGFTVVDVAPVQTRRLKQGANRDARVCAELVIELSLPTPRTAVWAAQPVTTSTTAAVPVVQVLSSTDPIPLYNSGPPEKVY